jgi:hybrid polyketide synthase/nonribosomal peptide synthetase ACE1
VVGQRHEALRTVFVSDDKRNEAVQGILPTSILHLERETVIADEQIIDAATQDMESFSFNFSEGPLLRLKLLSKSEDTHFIVLGYHHIVMDGLGFEIFCSDIDRAYHGNLETHEQGLLQYPDYALRQLHDQKRGSWVTQLAYWRAEFADLPLPLPLLSLSHISARPESSTFNSHRVSFRLTAPLEKDIANCCQALGIKAFHFYLATFGVLLFRFTDGSAKEVCIGVADGNRKQPDTLRSLGLFLNLLPLRVHSAPAQKFVDILKAVRVTSDKAFSNSDVPFDVILKELNVPRSLAHSPLFQTFLNYRQNVRESRIFLDCDAEGKSLAVGKNAYDISLDIIDSHNKENLVTMAANKDLYTIESAQVLGQSYINLLQSFAQDPTIRPLRAPLYPETDIQNAIRLGQGRSFTRSR